MSGQIFSMPIFWTQVPLIGLAVAAAILLTIPIARPDWSVVPDAARGAIFLIALVSAASMMPVKSLPSPSWETTLGLGFRLGGLRQYPANCARYKARQL